MNTDTGGLATIHSVDNNIWYKSNAASPMATLGQPVTLQAPNRYSTYRFPVYVSDVLVTRYE